MLTPGIHGDVARVVNSHRWVPKTWGGELLVANHELYCQKILYVVKGKRCSWHYHRTKDETFFLESGQLLVRTISPSDLDALLRMGRTMEELCEGPKRSFATQTLFPGDSLRVRPGTVHQFEAIEESRLLEVSTEHDDADSIRILPGST